MLDIFLGIFEFMLAILAIFGFIATTIYYGMTFIEERINSIRTFLKIFCWTVVSLCLLMPFAGFPNHIFFLTLASHGIWLFFLYTSYPFIYIGRPDFLCGLLLSVLSNVSFLIFVLSDLDLNFATTIGFFIVFVWGAPSIFVTSLAAAEDDFTNESRRNNRKVPRNAWASTFARAIEWARSKMPHRGNKQE
ncbi:hypothetical protein TRFO_10888 [Tritrichomonas foetus]|uniref:Uncharacterized protein n=1 Tax=Tritrichomonas foetus TaxID=1144522 RepID=A0A1J4JAQ7_9EUKA|nr:hypothetical protein TRFO_10888 [Tritrichomonas foetus]|eukprot:OHS94739.1 hypothetical protein TRFO_10888 [Tritrichomonas foetus]